MSLSTRGSYVGVRDRTSVCVTTYFSGCLVSREWPRLPVFLSTAVFSCSVFTTGTHFSALLLLVTLSLEIKCFPFHALFT